LITVKDKEIACYLLDALKFPYIKLGKHSKTLLGKLISIPAMDWRMYRAVKDFKPDLFLGLASVRAAHVASFLKKQCINFDDTENGVAELRLYLPFVSFVCTPSCYQKNLGAKQIRYDGYHELAYLHPSRFKPDPAVLNLLGVKSDEKYVIVRFVSWQAVHDIGHKGFSLAMKRKAVKEFAKYAKVFITSEGPLPKDLESFRLQIPAEKVHSALYYATLLFGESATMASESAVLATPAIYLDNEGRGYTDEEEKTYGLVFNFKESPEDQERSVQKGIEILKQDYASVKEVWRKKTQKLLQDKIDVTAWIENFINQALRP